MTQFNPNLLKTCAPPVMQARRWLEGQNFSSDMPLMNVSQAAPIDPPPEGLRHAMAEAVLQIPQSHLYGPVLGMRELREALADNISSHYQASVNADNIAITAGCNQAFCAAVKSLATQGDEVIVPTPWYFNHKMWLDFEGINTRTLTMDKTHLPDPAKAKTLITPKTRAIILVTPNNPSGVEYPPALIGEFYELAQSHGISLILDETYRDFHSSSKAPHDLFSRPDWDGTLIHLYSFSKSYRLTGHRVGAIATSPDRLAQVEKFLDSVAICAPQLGQYGALWGLRNLQTWLAAEREVILSRAQTLRDNFAPLAKNGWALQGCGAYFAYVSHPFDKASDLCAQALVKKSAILALPGTMFTPEGDRSGQRALRLAFANIDTDGIKHVLTRLESFTP